MIRKGERIEAITLSQIRILRIAKLRGIEIEVQGDGEPIRRWLKPGDTLDITRTVKFEVNS